MNGETAQLKVSKSRETQQEAIMTGSGQQIQVEPVMAKFSGFEVGKLNIIKVKVINKSQKPQRVVILPPQSAHFNVKFDKKGLLASGMAEDIYVHFTPNEYRYYNDSFRVNSELDHILVPIHAYPTISQDNLREVFPRLIDFGTIELGQSETFRYPLQCKIPLNFEFEFTCKDPHPDIQIQPMKGIIPGKGSVDVEITYQPSSNSTAQVEVFLEVAQYDFKPLSIKIMGSAKPTGPKKRPNSGIKLKSLKEQPEEQTPQQALDLINEIGDGQVQPENTYKPLIKSKVTRGNASITKRSQPATMQQIEKELSPSKLTDMSLRQRLEKAYLDHFNQVAHLDKEKDIRFFQCVGDNPMTEEALNLILEERNNYRKKQDEEYQRQGVTRYQLQLNSDCSIVEQVLPKYECTWDFDKNDIMKISRLKRKKFVFAVTRVIYRIRFDNRIQKIRAFLKGAKSREQVEKMVNQDWQKAEYAGVGKKDFISFQFEFEENNLGKFLLPVQYNTSNNFSSFRFDINPRTGFDDWAPIDQIPFCDQEVMQYKNWDYPQLVFHPPLQQALNFRTGAEEEYSIRGRMGPPQHVISEEPRMKALLQKPPEVETCRLLEPHRTLKYLHQYDQNNPVEPFYATSFQPITNTGADLDPEGPPEVVKQEFINRTPGYVNLPLLHELNLEQRYYQEKQLTLAKDLGFETEIDRYCPDLMATKEYDDNLTDDDSDGEGPPQLVLQNVQDFLKKIEHSEFQRSSEVVDLQDELDKNVARNLKSEKEKWLATMPSKTADYNKFSQNKLIIL